MKFIKNLTAELNWYKGAERTCRVVTEEFLVVERDGDDVEGGGGFHLQRGRAGGLESWKF